MRAVLPLLKKVVEKWVTEGLKEIERKRWERDYYFYKSAIGVFWIRPLTGRVGSYQLGIDGLPLDAHYSPYEAAEAVHKRKTGYSLWDGRLEIEPPTDLTNWTPGEYEL